MPKQLLIIDDEESICWGLKKLGIDLGCQVFVASSAEEGIEIAERESLDAIVTDVRLPGMSGLEAMHRFRELQPTIPIVVMTAYGDLKTAVEAVRLGALEYMVKPFSVETARAAITRALDVPASQSTTVDKVEPESAVEGFVAETPIMQEVFNRIALAAASPAHVLITGESGTGKELASRAIHKFSDRSNGPFVEVNLAALSPTLAESELFGHVRGAFTGAEHDRTGLLVQADGGTLFLDEVADIPLPIQIKLLRAIENQTVTPVGSNQPVTTRFRVIAATHRNLNELIREEAFRHDLFFRLAGFQIELPPLRNRVADIEPLARFFLNSLSHEPSKARLLTLPAVQEMKKRKWWGNVRELRNAMQHAMIVSRGGSILSEHLPAPMEPHLAEISDTVENRIQGLLKEWTHQTLATETSIDDLYERLLKLVEPPVLSTVMELNQNQFVAAAKILGLHRTTLKKKVDDLG
ncbi:MAG: sigma-54 dependent transcriptional regulator [Pirellulaceae bacterium]